MKLFYISNKKLNYFILLSFFVVIFIVLWYSTVQLLSPSHSILASGSIIKNYKSFSIDTDGDGKNDMVDINIDSDRKEYRVAITRDGGKKYILSPDSKTSSVGPYVPWWPLKITIADINIDGIPEIITQVSRSTSTLPLNIFRWNGKEYSTVLSGNFDGITIADINGDRVPEVIVEERIPGTGEFYTSYCWAAKTYRKVNTRLKAYIRGYDKIQAVVRYLSQPFDEKLPSGNQLKTYFTDSWIEGSNNIEYLNNFSKDVVGMQLEDYIGEEIEWENSIPKGDRWKLRYIVFRKFGTDVKLENYTAEIETEKGESETDQYKIKSIVFKATQ